MEHLAIMMNMKEVLEKISYESSSYTDIVKIANILIQDTKKLEQLIPKEPALMSLTKHGVTIALWRNEWIHHTLGHVHFMRSPKYDSDIGTGWSYYLCEETGNTICITEQEATKLKKDLIAAYTEYYGLGPFSPC